MIYLKKFFARISAAFCSENAIKRHQGQSLCFESKSQKNAVGNKASALAALSAADPVFQKDQDRVKIGLKFCVNISKRETAVGGQWMRIGS